MSRSVRLSGHPEVLAPVGGQQQLLAAVRSGANAVYLGLGDFNARRTAENFTSDDLFQTVRYCHARGVRVYVTLNTLYTDSQAPQIVQTIEQIALSGADAVIVQDLGVVRLVRQICPQLPLHASTQMTVHNLAGALALQEMGFSRVVLARELTAEEIRKIAGGCSLEIEVFVHGALCMSVSGQCYLSSMLGGKSGNRGLCAQPCRLDFTSGERHYALSLKDLSLVDQIDRLSACGVDSLKIEGRLKRPEYVAAAVTACRQAAAGQQPDLQTLFAVFSRSGFTDGYFSGKRDLSMFGIRTKEDVLAASTSLLNRISASVREETPLIPLQMTLKVANGAPVSLTVSDDAYSVTVSGPAPETARNRPCDEPFLRRGLEKTGGTPFYLDRLSAEIEPNLALPLSAVNALRKNALEQLYELRSTTLPKPIHPLTVQPGLHPRTLALHIPETWLRLSSCTQLSDYISENCDRIILPVNDILADPALIPQLGPQKLIAELPLMIFPGEEAAIEQQLAALKDRGISSVLCGNLGSVRMAGKAGLSVIGDYALNLLNSDALAEAASLGIKQAVISFELSMNSIAALGSYLPYGYLVYGHLPLMTFRNCPGKTPKGCSSHPCTLTDRKGNSFTLDCFGRRFSQLLNPIPLRLEKGRDFLADASFHLLRFTDESDADCAKILRCWKEGTGSADKRTTGLYYRKLL